MLSSTEIRQRAKELVDQLPGESLAEAVEFLEALCREAGQGSKVATSKPEEAALLQIIQRRLLEDDQTRLAYLRQQNESGEITQAEHQELLAYVDRVERQDAERAEALIQLAQIRGVDLKNLANEFLPAQRMSDVIRTSTRGH